MKRLLADKNFPGSVIDALAAEILAAARRAQAPAEHLAVIGRETLRLRRLPHAK